MFKLIDKLVFVLSIAGIIGLGGAYCSRYINPNTFVLPSLLGLSYPYLLIANFLLMLYWLARWKKMAWVVFAAILIGIPFFVSYYGVNKEEDSKQAADLTVMSFNVRYFDMYNWSKNTDTYPRLIEYINNSGADVVSLQEFPGGKNSAKAKDIVQKLTAYPYHIIEGHIALFSAKPIVNYQKFSFSKEHTSTGIICDILNKEDTLRIYNIHLESYKLTEDDIKFLKDISKGESSNLSEGIKKVSGRLTTANKNRAIQANLVKEHVLNSPYRSIICGDFNDTPLSYTYYTIKKGLKDSFIQKGRGLGNTYIGEIPSFRIDYILHSPEIETISYQRDKVILSDHYPIIAKVKYLP